MARFISYTVVIENDDGDYIPSPQYVNVDAIQVKASGGPVIDETVAYAVKDGGVLSFEAYDNTEDENDVPFDLVAKYVSESLDAYSSVSGPVNDAIPVPFNLYVIYPEFNF